jgi:cysteine desulfurase
VSAPTEIYLDWNATSPPHPEVLEAMTRAQTEAWGNPSSVHQAGRRALNLVEQARASVADLLGVQARDVVLASSATEANNLALHAARALVTSHLEHPSVTRVAERLAANGIPVEWLPVQPNGTVDLDGVELALRRVPRGALVALTAACHETGVVQPVREVAEVARRHGAHLHVDGVQALGKLPPAEWAHHADSIAINVHKVRGPKGIGVLAWHPGWSPRPLLVGGGQERGLRPGTVDATLAAGLLAAVDRARSLPAAYARLAPLRDRIEQALACWATVNGREARRLPHVTNLSFGGWYGDELVAALDLVGVRVSSGSACSVGSSVPTRAVQAMVGSERARSSLRISLGDATDGREVADAIERIIGVVTACAQPSSSGPLDGLTARNHP